MTSRVKYNRVLVKISGETLSGPGANGIDSGALVGITGELIAAVRTGAQVAVVVGAGNLIRGRDLDADPHILRTTADYMGMLATIVNALALRDALEGQGVPAVAMSALHMPTVCDTFNSRRAIEALETGTVVVFGGGTGSPFFTTDTCAALRACEIGADLLVKATQVEGVFDSDPKVNPDARKYDEIGYDQVLADRLKVMDLAAISICMENRMPIVVLASAKPGNLAAAIAGEAVGTLVCEKRSR